MKTKRQFTINEFEADQMLHLIKGLKVLMKKKHLIYMLEYLMKHNILNEKRTFKRGSLKYINSMEKKFEAICKEAKNNSINQRFTSQREKYI